MQFPSPPESPRSSIRRVRTLSAHVLRRELILKRGYQLEIGIRLDLWAALVFYKKNDQSARGSDAKIDSLIAGLHEDEYRKSSRTSLSSERARTTDQSIGKVAEERAMYS